ncbi:EAL domain-containing protein [Butyrivibrio sp. VCB2006]|uniref:EAL domain-containing protein n=1 Tax=Butyrivibrio sp. VCB2006 TaxID=1280679 RepID=UPI000427CF3D|nr:EAL domain-containing protein [Butyrivibrio sp. VCB2006]
MVNNVIYFEIASLPIFVVLMIATITRKMVKGRTNFLLFLIIIFAFVATFSDTVGNVIGKHFPLNEAGVIGITVSNYVYFTARSGMNAVYTYYLFSVTRTWYQIRQFWKRLIILLPYLITLWMLLFNKKTHYVFKVTKEVGYERGSLILVVYGLAALYMVFGIIYLVLKRHLLSLSECLSIATLYVFNVVGVIIQYFYSNMLVECYFTSMTLLFIVIFVQKPEKKIDMNTSLPGYFAYKEEIGKIESTGQKVEIIIASIANAEELNNYLGEKAYYEYIYNMNRAVVAYGKKEKVDFDLYFETPGNFYFIVEDKDYNPAQAIPEVRDKIRNLNGSISAMGVKADLRIVSVLFPEDINSANELIRFGHDFVRYTSGKIFCHADQILGQRNYQIASKLDEILGNAIDNQSLEVDFFPIWSASLERKMFYAAAPKVRNEAFGEIDTDTLEEALIARGSEVLMDEYVIERVFDYIGAGNLAKEGMSYVVVKLSRSLGMQTNFTDRIWNLRGKYNVHPEQVCFSIKESGASTSGTFDENIKKLSLQGYRIAIDGYGNGYSNVKRIAELPISSVRLDKSMLAQVDSAGGRAVLSGTIRTLTSIPLAVVASGVDDKKTRDMLFNMGCDLMQGKFFDAFEEKDNEKNSDSR